MIPLIFVHLLIGVGAFRYNWVKNTRERMSVIFREAAALRDWIRDAGVVLVAYILVVRLALLIPPNPEEEEEVTSMLHLNTVGFPCTQRSNGIPTASRQDEGRRDRKKERERSLHKYGEAFSTCQV